MSLFIAALALGAEQQATTPAKPVDTKPRLICVENTPIGSRIPGPRICRTAGEWDAERLDNRNETERAQRLNTIHG